MQKDFIAHTSFRNVTPVCWCCQTSVREEKLRIEMMYHGEWEEMHEDVFTYLGDGDSVTVTYDGC